MATPTAAPPAHVQPLAANRLPRKGVAIPKYDLRSIWAALDFKPHDGQKEVFEGWAVHDVTTLVAGTRWGKSKFGAHLPLAYIAPCWKETTEDGKRRYVDHRTTGAVIAPTYKLTGIIMGQLFQNVLKLCAVLGYPTKMQGKIRSYDVAEDDDMTLDAEPGFLVVRKVAGNIHTVITPWGNRFDAFTMKDPRGLLGQSFDWILTDESGQFTDGDWNNYFEYADRARLDREGWVYHGTTPKGFNALHDKFFVPGQPGPLRDGDYISFQQPTTRNTHMNQNQIERLRKRTPPRLWRMNYLAQFSTLEGQVYEEFQADTHVRTFAPRSEWLYFLAVDYGFTDPFVCLLMAWTGEEFVIVAEVYQAGLTAGKQKRLVAAMLDAHMPADGEWLDWKHTWTLWGDPRGGSNRAEWARMGVVSRKPNLHLKSGQRGSIEATSQVVAEYVHPIEDRPYPEWAVEPGLPVGAPRLFVHKRCTHTIHSFQSWVKDGNGYEGDDHGVDAVRYGILGARPVAKPTAEIEAGRRRRLRAQNQPAPQANRIRERRMQSRSGKPIDLGLR